MASEMGTAGGNKREPRPSKKQASATWFRLAVVFGVCSLLIALIVGALRWTPPGAELPLPHAVSDILRPATSSHDLVLTPAPPSCTGAMNTVNPIVAENICPGTESWRQTLPLGAANAINAFPVPASVNIGQALQLYVSTIAHAYTFSVYRVGWYQGHGARLLYTSPTIDGIDQPPPTYDPVTNAASDANWRDPVTLEIPASWVSGVYIVKFITSDGDMRYTLFVVRNDASHAPVLFQMALATYQAYNLYGGRSLYGEGSESAHNYVGRAYAVSFDRPYADEAGLSNLPVHEGPLIRFLERTGYNMSYMADVDLDLHPESLLQHKLLIVGGHDEYWSAGMRQAATNARDHGVSLAFFFSNSVYWQTRMSSSPLGPDRVVVSYKDPQLDPLLSTDPAVVTTQWASAPVSQPQNNLLGEMYVCIPKQPAPLVIAAGARPYLVGTYLHPGSALPNMAFGEVDSYVTNGFQPSHVTILASSPVLCKEDNHVRMSDATIYTAPSGAMVFDSGTFDWYLGLNVSWFGVSGATASKADRVYYSDMERFTINILNRMIEAPRRA